MKLMCNVEVVNRSHTALNIRACGKYLKSTIALGKEPKRDKEYFILHFSTVNKLGTKYKVKCIKQVFAKFVNEGKVTIRFDEPPHDLCIRSEVIQLKCFLKLLSSCLSGGENVEISTLCNVSVLGKDKAPTKLTVRDRSEFPCKGFPRTLEALTISGLKLCNFRRDILLLKHLAILDLSNNQIEKLPAEFGRMPNITEVNLSNNRLGVNVDWKWALGPQITQKLKLLDLSGNNIKELPKAIWKMHNLVTLKVDNNLLESLPATLGRINTLRYLTISHNQLKSLPCSLLQCHLEFLDLSANKFINMEEENSQNLKHNPWELYIGSLINIAAKVVLKNKLFYAPNLIPWTLVEYLDNANMCVCGTPVVSDTSLVYKEFILKDYYRTVVFNSNSNGGVTFECYFCSLKCLNK